VFYKFIWDILIVNNCREFLIKSVYEYHCTREIMLQILIKNIIREITLYEYYKRNNISSTRVVHCWGCLLPTIIAWDIPWPGVVSEFNFSLGLIYASKVFLWVLHFYSSIKTNTPNSYAFLAQENFVTSPQDLFHVL